MYVTHSFFMSNKNLKLCYYALRILLGVEWYQDCLDPSFRYGDMAASVSATPEWWFREKRTAIPKVKFFVYCNVSARYPFTFTIM